MHLKMKQSQDSNKNKEKQRQTRKLITKRKIKQKGGLKNYINKNGKNITKNLSKSSLLLQKNFRQKLKLKVRAEQKLNKTKQYKN